MLDHVAVVGASLAGLRFVEALRREGFEGQSTRPDALDRPPSKQFLVDDWEEEKLARAMASKAEAEWKLGVAATAPIPAPRFPRGRLDRPVDAVVLATGTRAPVALRADLEGVLELRALDDGADLAPRSRLRRSWWVPASSAWRSRRVAGRRLEVTVVEPLPSLIRGLGPVLGERVARTHRDEGRVPPRRRRRRLRGRRRRHGSTSLRRRRFRRTS